MKIIYITEKKRFLIGQYAILIPLGNINHTPDSIVKWSPFRVFVIRNMHKFCFVKKRIFSRLPKIREIFVQEFFSEHFKRHFFWSYRNFSTCVKKIENLKIIAEG